MSKRVPMCVRHGKPILPGHLRAGSKTMGCSDCEKERQARGKKKRAKQGVPPPEERMCADHPDTAISESMWLNGHKTKAGTPITCKRHPERRCNRARYVGTGQRQCGSCHTHRADGSRGAARVRSTNKQTYNRDMKNRAKPGFDFARAKYKSVFDIFLRSTGISPDQINAPSMGGRMRDKAI